MMDLRTQSLASRQVRLLIALGMLVAAPLGFAQEASAQASDEIAAEDPPPPGPGEMPPAAEPFSMCVRALAPCRESAAPAAFTTIDEGPAPTTPTFDAARHSTSVVMDPPDLAAFATGACSDGIDNDLDGVVDCADFDCQWDTNVPRDLCSPDGARRLCE